MDGAFTPSQTCSSCSTITPQARAVVLVGVSARSSEFSVCERACTRMLRPWQQPPASCLSAWTTPLRRGHHVLSTEMCVRAM
jgi:hypothetical protein